jgi:hypothetical protein
MRHDLGERVWPQRIKHVIVALSNSGRELFFLPTEDNIMNTKIADFITALFNFGIAKNAGCISCQMYGARQDAPMAQHPNAFDEGSWFTNMKKMLVTELLKAGLSIEEVQKTLRIGSDNGAPSYYRAAGRRTEDTKPQYTEEEIIKGEFAVGCVDMADIVKAVETHLANK